MHQTAGTPATGELVAELRSRRQALKLTQAALASKLGVTTNTVARWERGELHISNPERLSAVLARLERAARRSRRHNSQAVGPGAPADSNRKRPAIRHNLPLQLTSFIGRDQDLMSLQRLLGSERLLTLVGPGGIGKTRLAIQLAERMVADFQDGVWFVDLGGIEEPQQLPQAVATTLRVPEQQGQPLVERLKSAVSNRRALLLLDNCEHLVVECGELIDALLRAGTEIRIIVTSREALRIGGETTWPVAPLLIPRLDGHALTELQQADSVALFVERAQSVQPTFSLNDQNVQAVVEICRRLDGIPLAIELAAANISFLSPEQIVSRLEDLFALLSNGSRTAPPRQRSLSAAIEWSYGLLDAAEQRIFSHMSVFTGAVSLEAAEAVCSTDDIASSQVVQLIGRLVGKSLVVSESQPGAPNGYRMLETLRAYGRERLRAEKQFETLGRRHAQYNVALAQRSLYEASPASWADRLNRQTDDLEAALRWLLDHDDVDGAQLVGAALSNVWRQRGLVSEGRLTLAKLLGMPSSASPSRSRAAALLAAGYLATYQGDLADAQCLLEECVDVSNALGDARELPTALAFLADTDMLRGDWTVARARLEAGLAAAQHLADGWAEAMLMIRLAQVTQEQGDAETADVLVNRALPTLRAEAATRMVATGLQLLANGAVRRGEHIRARRLLEESLATWRSVRGWKGVASTLMDLGSLALEDHQTEVAETHFAESLKLCQDLGDRPGLALGFDRFAALAARGGSWESAVRLMAAATALRDGSGVQLSPRQTAWTAPISAEARRRLPRERFTAAWEAGASMTTEEAVHLALASRSGAIGARLSRREREVATLVARGCSNRQIAEALVITGRTAEGHVSNILDKLGLASRTQLATWAVENDVHLDLDQTASDRHHGDKRAFT